MSRRALTSGGPRGATLQVGFLVVTLGLALWLGWQALDAATSHRRTVEATLADYAGISAWELAGAARSGLDDLLDEAFEPVERRMRRSLPDVEVVGWELDDAARDNGCRCEGFESPLALFRITTAPTTVETIPESLPWERRERLADLVVSQPMGSGSVDDGMVTSPAGAIFDEDAVIGFMTSRDASGDTDVAYGFAVRASDVGELLGEIYSDRRLLPVPLAGELPNDSLLYVRIRDEAGMVLFAAPAEQPEAWSAVERIGTDFGGLVVEATVRPSAAGQLIIGGVPTSRLPLLAVLLVLTLGVGGAAMVQLRRETRFQQLRDDFVSGVSHELRTPLAQIQMFAELHEADKLPSEADRRRAISVIHRESRRLGHLVENILQFSRFRRSTALESPRERLDLAEGFAEGIDAVTPLLEARGMRVKVDVERGLPVLASREALTRIVVNLLDNAAKYGPSGQTVRVSVGRVNSAAQLAVTDEGTGVPASERARIWKPYRRMSRHVQAALPGTGIGLAVVAQLVAQHRGRAWVEDAEGGGARFVVELPLADVSSNGMGAA